MKKNFGFNYITVLSTIFAVCIGCYLYLVHRIVPQYIEKMLPVAEEMAKDYVNGSVKIGGITWQGGLSAEVNDVVLKDVQEQKVAVVPKARVHFRPWLALISPARALSKIELVEPELWMSLTKDNKWNVTGILKPSQSEESPFYGQVEVEKGKAYVTTPYGSWDFGLAGAVDAGANPKYDFKVLATAGEEAVELQGLMTTKGVGNLQVNTKKLSFAPYAPLVKKYASINEFAGELANTHVKWENNGKKSAVSGETDLVNLGGRYALEGKAHSFVFDGHIKALENILDVQHLAAVIDNEQELHLKGKADIHNLDDIGGQGVLSSPKLSYEGYAVEKLNLPFTLSKRLLQIEKGSACYGGGEVSASATLDLREDTLTADVLLKNVTHALSSNEGDIVKANGSLAVLARKDVKDNRETYQIHAGADALDLKWQDVIINKLNFDGDFDGRKLTVDHFSAYTGEGVLALKGEVVPEKDGPLAVEGRMAGFAIDPALNHFANIQGKGKLSMNFKVTGTTSSPEFGTAVQLRDVEVMEHKLREMHGFIAMKDNILTIKRLGATLTQGRHILDGTVDLRQQEPVLNLDLLSRHVRVEPLVAFVTKDYAVTGNLNNKLHIGGTPSHPYAEGELELTDGSVQSYLFKGISGKYVYDDGFVRLQDILIQLFIADVKLAGTMTKEQVLDFDLAAYNVDIAQSPYRSKDYRIEGLLSLEGHLSGSVAAPKFEGSVGSTMLRVNGEAFTDIAGSVQSDMKAHNTFNLSFKQPHQNAKGERLHGTGSFTAEGNADLVQSFVAGKVNIANGDIAGLLRTNKLDFALEGHVNGTVDICPEGKTSGIVFSLDSNDITTHNLRYDELAVKGSYKENIANIEEVLLLEKKATPDKGFIKAFGIVDLVGSGTRLEALAVEANPAIINVAMKDPLAIKGALNCSAKVTGSLAEPKAELNAEITKGELMGVAFDQAVAKARLLEDNIYIQELAAVKDVHGLSAAGRIPMDALRAEESRKNPEAEMDIALNLDKARLGLLTAMKYFEQGEGNFAGQVRVQGTLDEPRLFGSIKVEDGTIKVRDLNPVLEHIKLDAEFDGERAKLNTLALQIGKKGSVAVDGYYSFTAAAKDAYRVNIVAKNAELSYGTMFKGVINSELEILPQSYRDYWHRNEPALPDKVSAVAKLDDKQKGQALKEASAPAMPRPRVSMRKLRPLIKGKVRLDDVLANILMLSDSEPGSETNLGLDLELELGPKIHMQNAMFYDIWLAGGLSLKGGYYSLTTTNPQEDEAIMKRHDSGFDGLRIEGGIQALKGSITYLRTEFKLSEAKLNWTQPGEILPSVKLDSWTRFGRYRIYAKIDGSLGDIKEGDILNLTSSPPLEKNTLVRMLTLQRETASGGNDISNDDMNNVMSAGLQMALLGNVELWVKQTLGLDQFRVYTGKVNAGVAFDGSDTKNQLTNNDKNRYNVLISKYLTDKFMLGYTTDFNAEERVVFGQYDLGRHFNVTYSDKQKLDGDRKNWYGLEYRVDF